MQYVTLLRGINVGGNHKVEMKKLKRLFESQGYFNVSTYLNSGNVIFESKEKIDLNKLSSEINKQFGYSIPILVKTIDEMKLISKSIPVDWKNDTDWKCDVAYLFDEIDSKNFIDDLPIEKQFLDIRYIKGAMFLRVNRKNYSKSHINKLISHKYYQSMTIRNVNTARFLGK
jgi:uncharacterized protein (DUF1697 family)